MYQHIALCTQVESSFSFVGCNSHVYSCCDQMAYPDQLAISEVKIEIDVAEEAGPLWMTQDQTYDSSEIPTTSATPCETDTSNPSTVIQTDSDPDIKTEPTDHSATDDTFHHFKLEGVKVDIKHESVSCVDSPSSSGNPPNAVNSRPPNLWNKRSEVNFDFQTEPVRANINIDIKIEPVTTNINSDVIKTEPVTTIISSDVIKTEPVITNTSSVVIKTEPVTTVIISDVIKTEPVTTIISSDVIKTEPATTNINSDLIKTEPVITNTSSDVIKTEPVTTIISSDVIKTEPVTTIISSDVIKTEPATTNINSDLIKTEPVVTNTSSVVIKTEPVTTVITSDVIKTEPVTTIISSDVIKTEPVTTNTSSDVQTEAVTDVMTVALTGSAVRSESTASRDEEDNRPAGDNQKLLKPGSLRRNTHSLFTSCLCPAQTKGKRGIESQRREEAMSSKMDKKKKDNSAWCAAPNCSHSRKKGWKMFCFPKDPERNRLWVQNCRREDLLRKTADHVKRNCFLCSDHFEDRQFKNAEKKELGLNWKAVPTLFNVPNCPQQVTLKRRLPSRNKATPPKKARKKPKETEARNVSYFSHY
ncbi:uncharacterized protein LOC143300182 isoform X2 [Babylonia areolata]|uniref:uncharacterized protein LOC143300182 isoform X2 n=1 Tax=Babylonia areolata TaxID=304850 RepID=UPI003FCF4E8E